ncbi:MAG: hypothetical protein EOP35_07500 [Rubrivivax sp.]|nr:MAG: hypothetical protein EOP35_07500 [Rubrivivax sp.]
MIDQSRLLKLAAMLAIGACMLMSHPYEGLRHDGVLYLGQALLHSRVPALSQDTFFAGGSQDSYSIYAHLMVPLYRHFGLLTTHVAVLMTGWLLMLGAVLALLRRLEPSGLVPLWGALAFAVMSPIYGGITIIGYGEPFVTARSFAEPLLLWSLVALLDGRKGAAAALQILAAGFHPLMSLPVIVTSWCYLIQSQRRWLWLAALVPAVWLAALAGVRPWEGLLKTYDPYWWALVETSNPMVMLSTWTLDDQLRVVLDLAILLAVARSRPADAWTRLLYALIATAVGLVSLTAIGTDALHSVLVTQLQVWRVHWIVHLVAMALAPWLVVRFYRLGGLWPVSACALLLALLNSHASMGHGVATLSLWALVCVAALGGHAVSGGVVRVACGCILLCVLGLSAYQLQDQLGEISWQTPETFWSDGFGRIAASPVVAAFGFATLLFLAGKGRPGALAALSLSALLVGTAVFNWDQRPDLARAVEIPTGSAHPFAAHLPANATVYWPYYLVPVWSMLERPSHYSAQQGAGLLFNRDTALIFGARKETYRTIRSDRESCRSASLMTKDSAARRACDMPALDRLTALCGQQDRPDFMVLPGRLPWEPLATWSPARHREPPQSYALYACTQLASAPP